MECWAVHNKAYFHVSTDGEENNVLMIRVEQIIYKELFNIRRECVCSLSVYVHSICQSHRNRNHSNAARVRSRKSFLRRVLFHVKGNQQWFMKHLQQGPGLSRNKQVTSAGLHVNTCYVYIIFVCSQVSELQEYFLCTFCNIFLLFQVLLIRQACEPIKIMFVIMITTDLTLGANWIKQKDENWKNPNPNTQAHRHIPTHIYKLGFLNLSTTDILRR